MPCVCLITVVCSLAGEQCAYTCHHNMHACRMHDVTFQILILQSGGAYTHITHRDRYKQANRW